MAFQTRACRTLEHASKFLTFFLRIQVRTPADAEVNPTSCWFKCRFTRCAPRHLHVAALGLRTLRKIGDIVREVDAMGAQVQFRPDPC